MSRVAKIVGLSIGGFITLLFAFVVWALVEDHLAYERASITDQLVRDGMYDPASHFSFDRACTFVPESGLGGYQGSEYRELSEVSLPDTFTHWTLVLLDDHQKTKRTLYILNSQAENSGEVCRPSFILRTKTLNGKLQAYIEVKTQ